MVTKKDLAKLANETAVGQLKLSVAEEIIDAIFGKIVQAVQDGGKVEIINFGVFEGRKRAAKKARNPKTGEMVEVPARTVFCFKPSKKLKQALKEK